MITINNLRRDGLKVGIKNNKLFENTEITSNYKNYDDSKAYYELDIN